MEGIFFIIIIIIICLTVASRLYRMGYSHHWGTNPALRPIVAQKQNVPVLSVDVLTCIRAIVDAHADAVDETGTVIAVDRIVLVPRKDVNGQCYGTAFVWGYTPGGIHGGSCTTECGGAYDTLVCLILLVLRHNAYPGLFCISSDGDACTDWVTALALAPVFGLVGMDISTLRAYLMEEQDILRWMY
jgi:hypothetical protein